MGRNLVRLGAAGEPALTVVCFPWAGAGAVPFRAWSRKAPDGLALEVVRLGGREDRMRELPPEELDLLVGELAAELDTGRRYAFFGHCFGALLALEVAHRLRQNGGEGPESLLVVGEPPGHGDHGPPVTDVRAEMRRSGVMPEEVLDDPALFSLLEPAIAADLRLAHVAARLPERDPLSVPLAAFFATADPVLDRAAAEAWSKVTSGPARVRSVEGERLLPGYSWEPLASSVFDAARADGTSSGVLKG
ncbi:thioesterase II family protein [Streptomyces sp. NPDC058646]|uniref:thioesterase II family protein n=1 Tax=Streptomyces sp. NPDC058646 TaxID=3346574 RepID=UPI0036579A28